jgi:hypothetical protein
MTFENYSRHDLIPKLVGGYRGRRPVPPGDDLDQGRFPTKSAAKKTNIGFPPGKLAGKNRFSSFQSKYFVELFFASPWHWPPGSKLGRGLHDEDPAYV